jgi:hypothetical protein
MKKHYLLLTFFATIFITIVSLNGCKKENEEDLFPCDSDVLRVSFASDILPTIQVQCYSCHNNNAQSGGINLEGYNNIKRHAASGKLNEVLTIDRSSPRAMPPGGQLPEKFIEDLNNWVEGCAPEN